MNLGQAFGIAKLRIMQLEDELAGTRVIGTAVPSTAALMPELAPVRMRDGLPKRIVDLLEASDRPLASAEIAAALDCDLMPLYQRLPKLIRTGRITREGRRKHFRYHLAR